MFCRTCHASLIGLVGVAASCSMVSFKLWMQSPCLSRRTEQDTVSQPVKAWNTGRAQAVWELMSNCVTKMTVPNTTQLLLVVPVVVEAFRRMLLPEQGDRCQLHETQSRGSPPGWRLQHTKSYLCPLLREYMETDSWCCYAQDYTGYPWLKLWWLVFLHVRIQNIKRETGKGLACFLHSVGTASSCVVFVWTAVRASWLLALVCF